MCACGSARRRGVGVCGAFETDADLSASLLVSLESFTTSVFPVYGLCTSTGKRLGAVQVLARDTQLLWGSQGPDGTLPSQKSEGTGEQRRGKQHSRAGTSKLVTQKERVGCSISKEGHRSR